jgi:hypothetical protein
MKQMEQNNIKEIEDLTEKVKEKATHIYNFPTEVVIKEAKLLLSLDDKYYIVSIKYNIDEVEYEDKKIVVSRLTDIVDDMLFRIKDFYERTHKLE